MNEILFLVLYVYFNFVCFYEIELKWNFPRSDAEYKVYVLCVNLHTFRLLFHTWMDGCLLFLYNLFLYFEFCIGHLEYPHFRHCTFSKNPTPNSLIRKDIFMNISGKLDPNVKAGNKFNICECFLVSEFPFFYSRITFINRWKAKFWKCLYKDLSFEVWIYSIFKFGTYS